MAAPNRTTGRVHFHKGHENDRIQAVLSTSDALTLWNLHPFPSIIQVPELPEVALDDVLRAKPGSFDERFSHSGRDMFRPELLDGAEVVKRLSIRDKIAFWREVMQHARDRGIDVYWFTWNVFLFGAEGKHGLKRQGMGEDEVRYFRASVRETVKTYPLLAGIGITAGENMDEPLAGRDRVGTTSRISRPIPLSVAVLRGWRGCGVHTACPRRPAVLFPAARADAD